jgi:LysM repeat protein
VILHHVAKDTKTRTTTYSSGRFYEMGMLPGPYRVYVDPQQLQRSGYRCEPPVIEIDVESETGGAIIEDLDFLIVPADHEPISVTPNHGTGERAAPQPKGEDDTGSSSGARTYVVKRGDTQWSIANKLGVTVDQLCRANNMARGETIRVGQRLIVPSNAASDPTASVENSGGASRSGSTDSSNDDDEPRSTGPSKHIVQAGETLWSIARKYNTSVSHLRRMNGLGGTSRLIVGQELIVGGEGQTLAVHRVQRGETLYRIARKYAVDVQELIAVNDLAEPDRLQPGTNLRIPVN